MTSIGLGIGLGMTNQRPPMGFVPGLLFSGGAAGTFYDVADTATLFQDSAGTVPVTADGDPVGLMRDKSGNGNHAVQATPGARPLYKTSGGLHWLESDGIDDFLRATFTITQPFERVSAIRQIGWSSGLRVYGGVTTAAGVLQQNGTTPQMRLYDGLSIADRISPAIGADVVITERHAGASSRLTVNNDSYTTTSPGTTLPGGVTLFASNAGLSPSNVRFYGMVMIAGTLADADIASARTYFGARAGLTL